MLRRFYDKIVLAHPKTLLFLIIAAVVFFGFQARNLIIDASSETLLLEDDQDLKYTREVYSRYGVHDFLVVTFTPSGDLLSENSLAAIKQLKTDLANITGVDSVTTILDVPLLESPPKPISEIIKNVPTLESPGVDLAMAREEFVNSPIYRNLLVSPDFKTTALQANLPVDEVYQQLLRQRDDLKSEKRSGGWSREKEVELERAEAAFKAYRGTVRDKQHRLVRDVREVIDKHRGEGVLFLGGVSMIADDLVSFVKNDLRVFGVGVLVFLILTLLLIFRQLRWILLPLVCVVFSAMVMGGILGLTGWEVTVISSNFISLQLIMTMAFTVHLTVRYRELLVKNPGADQRSLVLDTVLLMFQPCLYSALTTMAGFGSLLFSGILPVVNFGWMMGVGILVSLAMTFLIFPVVVVMLNKRAPNVFFEDHFPLTKVLARFTEKQGSVILALSLCVLVLSGIGVSRLVVENSFISYFKETTEIYQGLRLIDRQLGGTTPLDITIDMGSSKSKTDSLPSSARVLDALPTDELSGETPEDEFDEFSGFEEEFVVSGKEAKYWFTEDKMKRIREVHDYLDGIPETGKVFSLGTLLKVGEKLNNGKPLDNFQLALLYSELPEEYRDLILKPYVSVEENQVRFSVRVRDSDETLRRNELLEKIRADLTGEMGFAPESVHFSGLLVLYNNLLQSLFRSQILTLGVAVGALMIMFLLLFRSVVISLIAILPNLLSIGCVLGFMGWAGIPLDMMTITIAAISMGIAVDNTIHYLHRFRLEFPIDRNYVATMHRCHRSIGYAMYYTSLTIIIGFSILVLSNFIPTIYFGLLTGLAMLIALVAALTLLPRLIIWIRPFGPEGLSEG